MDLQHAVITSVDRDDLDDGGAGHFADVIQAIRKLNPKTAVEVLTPDFRGSASSLDTVLEASPDVFSHNMETVPSLYRAARPGSDYAQSLGLLREASARQRRVEYEGRVKTGLMLGIGEERVELDQTIKDIADAGAQILTPRSVPPAHSQAPPSSPLGPPRRIFRTARDGTRPRLRTLRIGASGALELSRPRTRRESRACGVSSRVQPAPCL